MYVCACVGVYRLPYLPLLICAIYVIYARCWDFVFVFNLQLRNERNMMFCLVCIVLSCYRVIVYRKLASKNYNISLITLSLLLSFFLSFYCVFCLWFCSFLVNSFCLFFAFFVSCLVYKWSYTIYIVCIVVKLYACIGWELVNWMSLETFYGFSFNYIYVAPILVYFACFFCIFWYF